MVRGRGVMRDARWIKMEYPTKNDDRKGGREYGEREGGRGTYRGG